MAYVPGFDHDIFVSYAHGDDREWIIRFAERLKPALKQRIGVDPVIWIDDDNLRRSRNFATEIPDALKSCAVFLFLPSPTYVRSTYCVQEECRLFRESIPERRERFSAEEFANELFAFRCPILPVDGNEHWELMPGLTDISFCDSNDCFPIGSPEFETSFRRLTGELIGLLKRLRNHATPIFVYPPSPGPDLLEAHAALANELAAQSYRLLPDRKTNLVGQLREASMSVFLLGSEYEETAAELTEAAQTQDKPWLVWCSPAAENSDRAEQVGFCRYLENVDSPGKTYLSGAIRPAKLKEEVLALAKPLVRSTPAGQSKPSVYLIYNARDRAEVGNAGLIVYHYRKEFNFHHPDDPGQHTMRLTGSDGVLLVWGQAEEEWCATEFAELAQAARRSGAKGLCVFDPMDTKVDVITRLRQSYRDICIAEQYGRRFEPGRLEPFFNPIRRRARAVER